MTTTYRGFEITVTREKTLAGWNELVLTAMRKEDGWFLVDTYSESNDKVKDMMAELKRKVDDYYDHPKEWDEE